MRYLLYLPLLLTMTAISYPLAPILVLFERDAHLPWWAKWFETYDHDLHGGLDWQLDHPNTYKTWWGMTNWLWRNPIGRFSYEIAGIWPTNPVHRQGDHETSNRNPGHSGCCLTTCPNTWLFNYVHQWGNSGRCLRIVLGWKLYYEQDNGIARDFYDLKSKPAQWVMVIWPLAGFDNKP
jgi:hypothetical protein